MAEIKEIVEKASGMLARDLPDDWQSMWDLVNKPDRLAGQWSWSARPEMIHIDPGSGDRTLFTIVEYGRGQELSFLPGTVNRSSIYNAADRKAKTAKNKRRSRARWRRRELRRNGGSAELSAAALPPPAPSFGSSEAGEPGAEALRNFNRDARRIMRGISNKNVLCDAYLGGADPDGLPAPLSTPERPKDRPFVPNKFGEHG